MAHGTKSPHQPMSSSPSHGPPCQVGGSSPREWSPTPRPPSAPSTHLAGVGAAGADAGTEHGLGDGFGVELPALLVGDGVDLAALEDVGEVACGGGGDTGQAVPGPASSAARSHGRAGPWGSCCFQRGEATMGGGLGVREEGASRRGLGRAGGGEWSWWRREVPTATSWTMGGHERSPEGDGPEALRWPQDPEMFSRC